MADDLPDSVLFACSHNSVRSPMAEGILKHLMGHKIYVDSASGAQPREVDGFAIAVMEEIGIDISRHRSKGFDDLEDTSFDLIVTMSPEAQHKAIEMTRVMACEVEYWPTMDPTVAEGNRDARLDAYRDVRDRLFERIRTRFEVAGAPKV